MFVLKTISVDLVKTVNFNWYEDTKWPVLDYYYGRYETIVGAATCFLPQAWFEYSGYRYKTYGTRGAAQRQADKLLNKYTKSLEDLANFDITIEEI